MYSQVNFPDFQDRFQSCRPDNFTYEGLKALFDYLEQYEDNTGESIEFDCIAICCDFSEYENMKEFKDCCHGDGLDSMDDIAQHTTVIPIDDESFIIQNF